MVSPAKASFWFFAIRKSIFNWLIFFRRVVHIKKVGDEEEPSFIVSTKQEQGSLFKKSFTTQVKSFTIGWLRVIKKNFSRHKEMQVLYASSISFQDMKKPHQAYLQTPLKHCKWWRRTRWQLSFFLNKNNESGQTTEVSLS